MSTKYFLWEQDFILQDGFVKNIIKQTNKGNNTNMLDNEQ